MYSDIEVRLPDQRIGVVSLETYSKDPLTASSTILYESSRR